MANKMKRRSRARELALQALYQVDLTRDDDREKIDWFLKGQESEEDPREFARTLIHGTLDNQEEIDAMISEVTQNWALSRMAVIDRNVLRIATHELLHRDDIPPKVSINEAIEIGKRFSTTNSGAFINGILDKIMNHHLPESTGDAEPAASDAELAAPDAELAAPDAEPAAPDAELTAPDAEPTAPDAELAASDAEPAAPDAEPAAPDAEPAASDAEPAAPDAEPAAPDAEPAAPEAEPAAPDAELAEEMQEEGP